MIGTVVVHSPDHLRAVFEAAERNRCVCRAVTAEWAGLAYGALYWAKATEQARKACPGADVAVALNCGDDAGRALAALRERWRYLVFLGDQAVAKKLADIAARQDAALVEEPDQQALDLEQTGDVVAALDAWMGARRRCK